jgi:hypothetical protein
MQLRRARELIVNLIDDPQHYHHHFATSVDVLANIAQPLTFPQVHIISWDVFYI